MLLYDDALRTSISHIYWNLKIGLGRIRESSFCLCRSLAFLLSSHAHNICTLYHMQPIRKYCVNACPMRERKRDSDERRKNAEVAIYTIFFIFFHLVLASSLPVHRYNYFFSFSPFWWFFVVVGFFFIQNTFQDTWYSSWCAFISFAPVPLFVAEYKNPSYGKIQCITDPRNEHMESKLIVWIFRYYFIDFVVVILSKFGCCCIYFISNAQKNLMRTAFDSLFLFEQNYLKYCENIYIEEKWK